MKTKKTKNEDGGFKVELVDEMSDKDFFDDCPVCQAMKLAKEQGREPTLTELKGAFQKAKEQGGVVGGEWFEKNE